MNYKNLEKTKFMEGYQKTVNGDIKPTKAITRNSKVYVRESCKRVLMEHREGKYIIEDNIMANIGKEKRIRCICGKVNVY